MITHSSYECEVCGFLYQRPELTGGERCEAEAWGVALAAMREARP